MQDIVAGISDIMLDIEYQLKNQIGCQPLPFPGMDSKYTTNNDALDNYFILIITRSTTIATIRVVWVLASSNFQQG